MTYNQTTRLRIDLHISRQNPDILRSKRHLEIPKLLIRERFNRTGVYRSITSNSQAVSIDSRTSPTRNGHRISGNIPSHMPHRQRNRILRNDRLSRRRMRRDENGFAVLEVVDGAFLEGV